ncbi:hypothetical protein B0A50_03290 [Salinomyces thailandicus]|uniref:Uncharacterized protein n=1 Tax=Salinomyces thailandicus TaxID=706561 RepID=A0A4V5N4R4_9PEZI|nr:hypothetical protein B0A50_03290 [Salinomyces thailandica]
MDIGDLVRDELFEEPPRQEGGEKLLEQAMDWQSDVEMQAPSSPFPVLNDFDTKHQPQPQQPQPQPEPSVPSLTQTPPQPHTPIPSPLQDTLAEHNLPPFMHKIETGTYSAHHNTWLYPARAKPTPLLNPQGQPILSPTTHKPLKHLPFLPTHIPETAPAWHLNLWLRHAAETGIYIGMTDLTDRVVWVGGPKAGAAVGAKRRTTLSMRVQRYNQAIGQLPVVEKRHAGLPPAQAMATLEGLSVLQVGLNTWWVPNHWGREGPWVVVQPGLHPGYEGVGEGGRGGGKGVVVERAWGLSERVRKIGDGMVFLDGLAEEAGFGEGAVGRAGVRRGVEAEVLDEEFRVWREGGYHAEITVAHTQRALENAGSEEQVLAVLRGDWTTIFALQQPLSDSPETDRFWQGMSDERVAFLQQIAERYANAAQLPHDILEIESQRAAEAPPIGPAAAEPQTLEERLVQGLTEFNRTHSAPVRSSVDLFLDVAGAGWAQPLGASLGVDAVRGDDAVQDTEAEGELDWDALSSSPQLKREW